MVLEQQTAPLPPELLYYESSTAAIVLQGSLTKSAEVPSHTSCRSGTMILPQKGKIYHKALY